MTRTIFSILICALGLGLGACKGSDTSASRGWDEQLPAPKTDVPLAQGGTRAVVFGGGCFWCVEAVFEQLDGVKDAISGYAGGDARTANYSAVTGGDTGHAEVVQVLYDPSKISYGTLLRVFFATHDPTQLNRQGPDVGTQYRSAVFYATDEEKRVASAYIDQLNASGEFKKPIVTRLEKLNEFYVAEEYHQNYAEQNPNAPYIRVQARPKVDKVKKQFPELVK